MKLPRRNFLHLAAGAAALPVASRIAFAQAYPSRPVRWIVGFAPGGGNDIVARLMGQWLSERTGQQFIIENRPGAGTNIATEAVVNAPPDGYTLLLTGLPNASNASLYEKLNFNFIRDIAPIAGIARGPQVMVVIPSVPAKTVPEFIAYATANPGKVNMGSAGTGSVTHLAGELFKMMAGVNLVHVPFRGNGPALTAMLGGQVEVQFPSVASSLEYIRAGKLRGLAISGAMRSAVLPDLPTVGEFMPGGLAVSTRVRGSLSKRAARAGLSLLNMALLLFRCLIGGAAQTRSCRPARRGPAFSGISLAAANWRVLFPR